MVAMRTIENAYKELKESDPASCITKTALRALVVAGDIPSVRVGVKYLVNLETVRRFFEGGGNALADD